MAEKTTVLDKIEAGNYKVPRFKLLPPAPPILLKKALHELTDAEMDEAMEQRRSFAEEQQLFEMAQQEHEEIKLKALQQLQADLEEEFGVPPGYHADQVFGLAKAYAAGNMGQLYAFYTDLAVLVLPQPIDEQLATDKDEAVAA